MACLLGVLLFLAGSVSAQTLLNLDFGVGAQSAKTGLAGAGRSTNDFWNLYRHYEPRFTPGMPLVADGKLDTLKLADGTASPVSVTVSNASGVWGNASGDPMFDTYLFAPNGSNILVTLAGLLPGSYYFYLYGHADPDVLGEQNSLFTLRIGTNRFGPLTTAGSGNWKTNTPLREYAHYVVFRDIRVPENQPVLVEVAPSPNGVAVINGLQIVSRGTSPPKLPTLAVALEATHLLDPRLTNVIFREVRYAGRVSDHEARFAVTLHAESFVTNEIAGPLFDGEVALLATNFPPGARIVSEGRQSRLVLSAPGQYTLRFELLAKITKSEPWNQIAFTGPPAAIAAVEAQAETPGVEIQLLNGTQAEVANASRITGSIAADRVLALRWQSKTAEITRQPLLTVDTAGRALVKPTGIEYTTALRYEILQAPAARLTVELPAGQSLTRLQGPQIRDWQVRSEGARQLLTIDFIKPLEQTGELTLFSEQGLAADAPGATLTLPQPLEVQREIGTLTVAAEEMAVEIASAPGLRQVNAPTNTVAAFRFFGRPVTLVTRLKRFEPVVKTFDRVTARLEETRLLVFHALTLTVEKAGIYAVELTPQTGLTVAQVRGDGVDDWKVTGGKLQVSFGTRALGTRRLEVQLEQPLKTFPDPITVSALRVTGATNETAQIGAASALGIRLKTTGDLNGLREIPVSTLSRAAGSWPAEQRLNVSQTQEIAAGGLPAARADELLAFAATQPDWQLTLAAERLPARIVAEVFNLVTLGDGLVGGSATIRYGLINQGVQEFRVTLPAHWRNVEFIGPNIRRRELATPSAPPATPDTNHVTWALSLQDKVWGGYTLVVTYDYQFDPQRALLDLGGAHVDGVERETGSVAITSADRMELETRFAEPLRQIDPAELADTDRALITRTVLRAYRYAGETFTLGASLTRHDELRSMLNAVADRTQLTSVLTEEGQMLSQASFMVKNNDKQFQRFRLPPGAELWGCYVNQQPVKAEQDGDWLLVSLPREANRDEAFAVDLKYKEKFASLKDRLLPTRLALRAPRSDVPNTYAEWMVYVPANQRLSSFGGNMTVARGTTYGLRDGWRRFAEFYAGVFKRYGVAIATFGGGGVMLIVFLGALIRRGSRGLIQVLVALAILVLLAGMLLPSLSKAKRSAQKFAEAVERDRQLATQAQVPGLVAAQQQAIQQRQEAAPAQPSPPPPPAASRPVAATQSPASGPGQGGGVLTQAKPVDSAPGGVGHGPTATPVAAGLRSIKIDIPLSGQAYAFTKVLNISDEPLSVSLRATRLKVYHVMRSSLQLACFLAGLGLIGFEWRRRPTRSLPLALGLALVVGSVGHLLIAARVLHYCLIAALPVLALWLAVRLFRKFWPRPVGQASRLSRTDDREPDAGSAPAASSPAVPPVVGLILLGLVAGGFEPSASAADPAEISNLKSQISNPSPAPAPDPTPHSALRIPHSTILSAVYTGTVREKVAQFDATLEVSTFTTNQIVALFGDDVALQDFSTEAKDAPLLREGAVVSLRLPARTTATVKARLVVKLAGDVTKRQLAFAIPPALASQLNLRIEEEDADVDFPTAVTFRRTTADKSTRVEAILGAGTRVELFWTPRMKRATEVAASVFAQNTSMVSIGGGVVNTRTTLDYQVAQGELRQARVRVPAGQRLLRVEGESIRLWELKEESPDPVLVVDLIKPAAPAYKLTLETEKPLDPLPAQVTVAVPHALDVIRETGLVGLHGTEELSLAITSDAEVQRVDAGELAKTLAVKSDDVFSAYRFLKPGFRLTARAETIQPQIEALVHNATRVGFEQVSLTANVDYAIKKAGVFALRLGLPDGFTVDAVSDESAPLQWTEKANPRTLEVALKERRLGALALRLHLSKAHKELPASLAIAGVVLLEVSKRTGYVSVSADPGLALKTDAFDGLTEIPAAQLAEGGGGAASPSASRPAAGGASQSAVLAFKSIGTDPATVAPWRLSVSTETVESWVRAEVVNVVSVTETLLSGRSIVRYDIQSAPLKDFRVKTPPGWRNVEVYGANLRRRDETNSEWRIELQNKVRGAYTLTFTWEQPRPVRTNALMDLAGLETLGTERETGWLVVQSRPAVQISAKTVPDILVRIDARELPAWAGVPATGAGTDAEVPVLVYRYLRAGYRLAVESRRFEEAAVLQALVDDARFTTVVADDGQMMTEMVLNIRNNGLQHLALELPAHAEVWSAFVAGQPVRPSVRAGKLLLPLERAGDTAVDVELTYVSVDRFPRSRGRVAFASPKLAAPLKNARWELYLPLDYEYTAFQGSMSHDAEAEPAVQGFSVGDYARQQKAKQVAVKSEFNKALSNVRNQLATGNFKEANRDFNQAFALNSFAEQDRPGQQELDNLKRDLSRVQRSNLIEAQRRYTFENVGKLAAKGAPQPAQGAQQAEQAAQLVQYDEAAAERQIGALQKAQEVAVAKVQPLRANLPTRGQRHVFSQLLQTEVNQPMTIEFTAHNTKTVGWLSGLAYVAGGFLFLWALAAVVASRRAARMGA